MNCHCGKPLIGHYGTISTLVGYSSPPEHDHDDNCKERCYTCENGHINIFYKRNKCTKCDWKGKLTCFCHPGDKIDEWPNEIYIDKIINLEEWEKEKIRIRKENNEAKP